MSGFIERMFGAFMFAGILDGTLNHGAKKRRGLKDFIPRSAPDKNWQKVRRSMGVPGNASVPRLDSSSATKKVSYRDGQKYSDEDVSRFVDGGDLAIEGYNPFS